jgi:hypothetical protein
VTADSWLSRAAVLLALLPSFALAQAPRDALVGSWRGTSLCTDRQAAPACADEQVIYDVSAPAGTPDALIVKADKIVDGRRVPMGDVIFHAERATGRWVNEIKTPNVNALFYLSLKDGVLSGGMSLVPSGTVVRAIELRRAQGSE